MAIVPVVPWPRPKRRRYFQVWVHFVVYPHAAENKMPIGGGLTLREAKAQAKAWEKKNLPELEHWRPYMMAHAGFFVRYWIEETTTTLLEEGEFK